MKPQDDLDLPDHIPDLLPAPQQDLKLGTPTVDRRPASWIELYGPRPRGIEGLIFDVAIILGFVLAVILVMQALVWAIIG